MSYVQKNKKPVAEPAPKIIRSLSGRPRFDSSDLDIDRWAADNGCGDLFAALDHFEMNVINRATLRKELQLYLRLRDRSRSLEALPFSRERESERRNTCVRMAAIKDGMVRYLCSFARNEYDSATRFLNAVFGKHNWRNPIYCFIGDESLG